MTEHESLVEAILDDPDDDTRRLVYADWLEEHGTFIDGKRAQLLRIEVEKAKAIVDSSRWKELVEQEKALEARYNWLMLPLLPPGFERPRLDRGIIRLWVSLAVPRFTEWGEDYLRGLPCYCRFYLRLNRPPGKGKLMDVLGGAAWPRVFEFWLRKYRFAKGETERFLSDPRLRNLEDLSIEGGGFGDEALRAAAGSTHLLRLRSLYFNAGTFSDAGLDALASSNAMPRLTSLCLPKGALTERALGNLRTKRPRVEVTLISPA